MWCHFTHLYPATDHNDRVSKYKDHIKDVDYTGITFPVTIAQIMKTEK